MELESVRHEIVEVDGVPVVGAVLTIVIGGAAYAFTILGPAPESQTIWEHLTFRTTEVEATVETWYESGTCKGVEVYDSSPRIHMTLSWVEDGYRHVGSFTGCGASVDSPQHIWVTADADVASQSSPWADHFWPALFLALVPLAFVWTFVEGVRTRRRRRRRTAS